MDIKTKKPPRAPTPDQAAAMQRAGFVWDAGSARAQAAEVGRRVRDLPTLIAWAHRAGELGRTARLPAERRGEATPDAIDGLDAGGRVWRFLCDELRALGRGVTETDLWVLATSSAVDFHTRPDLEQQAEAARSKLAGAAPGTFDRLAAELRERFPQAAADLPSLYMPPQWFRDEFGIKAERLRTLHRRHPDRMHVRIVHGRSWYSVPDAMDAWPHDVLYLPSGTNPVRA